MMSKRSIDIDEIMYAPYSSVDCKRVFQTRKEKIMNYSLKTFDKPFNDKRIGIGLKHADAIGDLAKLAMRYMSHGMMMVGIQYFG